MIGSCITRAATVPADSQSTLHHRDVYRRAERRSVASTTRDNHRRYYSPQRIIVVVRRQTLRTHTHTHTRPVFSAISFSRMVVAVQYHFAAVCTEKFSFLKRNSGAPRFVKHTCRPRREGRWRRCPVASHSECTPLNRQTDRQTAAPTPDHCFTAFRYGRGERNN